MVSSSENYEKLGIKLERKITANKKINE